MVGESRSRAATEPELGRGPAGLACETVVSAEGAERTAGPATVVLTHNKVRLALHRLRPARPAAGTGRRPLLLLHGLGERTPDETPAELDGWPGEIWGLDFTGHGRSTVPKGGGYTCELLMGDADLALAHLGPVTLCGRGLGGYVAVLLAGARPELVRGTVVCDGPGLAGRPATTTAASAPLDTNVPAHDGDRSDGDRSDGAGDGAGPPDRYALHELGGDVRAGEYAAGYASEAVRRSGLGPAVVVCARDRPAWLAAVLEVDGVETGDGLDLAEAVGRFG